MEIIKNLLNSLAKTKYYLIAANLLLVFFLIFLSNIGVLPLRMGDFIFFSSMYLIFALYRPGWSFLFFVGTIMLENINLAPGSLGIFVRPYQIIGALTIVSLVLRYFTKRLNFELVKLKWFDFVIFVFGIAGIISSVFAESKGVAFKQSLILITFIALYWLVRNYIQTWEDVKKIAPFFLSSSVIVVFYGIWQNIRFIRGGNSFEVMPGRPNGTFAEADWLGVFLVLLVAVVYTICHSERRAKNPSVNNNSFIPLVRDPSSRRLRMTILYYLALIPIFILLILTVSRSAWLGAGFITLIFLKAIFTNFSFHFRDWKGKELLKHFSFLVGAGIISLGFVYIFHLTNFQLFNRAQSTGSGLQKITVACDSDVQLPEKIGNVSQLEQYGCRHINLEDIQKERDLGFEIKEMYRTDPNVNVRAMIYQKSWEQIKEHPVFGIGWGNISNVLGKDERGAGLNSSNIFLEVWLGSGIIGLLAFLVIWVYLLVKSVLYCVSPHTKAMGLFKEDKISAGDLNSEFSNANDSFGVGVNKMIGAFLALGLFALLIPNLFNAGVFLGILWVWFGIALSINIKKE